MKKRRWIALARAVVTIGVLIAYRGAWADEPFRAIRALQALQAQIATGLAPPAAQAARIAEIAADFRAQPSAVWNTSQNAQALALFLFNGGDSATAQAIKSASILPSEDGALVDAALAHSEGRIAPDKNPVLLIDARTLSPLLAGHVALAQATWLAATDITAALERLNYARLVMSGTLVEEAALRRTVFLLDAGKDPTAFHDATRRYRARFSLSAYADNFEKRIREVLIERWPASEPEARVVLTEIAEASPNTLKAALWLDIAKRALTRGAASEALYASARARDAAPRPEEQRRADLYSAVSNLFVGNPSSAAQQLRAIEDADRDERDLRRAAVLIADNINAPLSVPGDGLRQPISGSPSEATIKRAQSLLDVMILP